MFTNVTYIRPRLKTIQMSINWWMNNTMWNIHTMDCPAIKRNKLLIHVQHGQAWKFPPLLALRGTRTSVLFLSVISRSPPKHRLTPIFCGVPVWGFPFPTPSWHLIKAQVLQWCFLRPVHFPPSLPLQLCSGHCCLWSWSLKQLPMAALTLILPFYNR